MSVLALIFHFYSRKDVCPKAILLTLSFLVSNKTKLLLLFGLSDTPLWTIHRPNHKHAFDAKKLSTLAKRERREQVEHVDAEQVGQLNRDG